MLLDCISWQWDYDGRNIVMLRFDSYLHTCYMCPHMCVHVARGPPHVRTCAYSTCYMWPHMCLHVARGPPHVRTVHVHVAPHVRACQDEQLRKPFASQLRSDHFAGLNY